MVKSDRPEGLTLCSKYFNIDLDVGEAWTLDSDDELSCYGDELNVDGVDGAAAKTSDDLVTLHVDRKSSTGSQVKVTISVQCILQMLE